MRSFERLKKRFRKHSAPARVNAALVTCLLTAVMLYASCQGSRTNPGIPLAVIVWGSFLLAAFSVYQAEVLALEMYEGHIRPEYGLTWSIKVSRTASLLLLFLTTVRIWLWFFNIPH